MSFRLLFVQTCALCLLLASQPSNAGENNAKNSGGGKAKAQDPGEPGEWQKLETKAMPLADPRHLVSPGLFDMAAQKLVTFVKDAAVDLGLPHAGTDANGKPYPAFMAKIVGDFVWVDLNGDGKAGGDETRHLKADELTDPPFSCELHYEDGSAGQYSFRLKPVIEKEKYAVIRCTARVTSFLNQRVVVLDDDGNGKYNDIEFDALMIGDSPVSLLGRYVQIDDQFYEILVHVAGAAIEVRPVKLDFGYVDIFAKYQPTQKSENLKIHTIVISGENGSFAFNDRRKKLKVPVGSYDLCFGLLERAKEVVFIRRGEKTSFNVSSDETSTPVWGGKITAKFELESDGSEVVVYPPRFTGTGSEEYVPEHFRTIPISATINQVFVDSRRIEHVQRFGQKNFKVQPDGSLKPVVFKPMRAGNDIYEVAVDYNSGILGSVLDKLRMNFTFQRKEKEKEKKNR